MLYADILFPRKINQDKETLTYQIPTNLKLIPGQIVKATLRNNLTHGLILAVHKEKPKFKTLPIQEILYKKPLLSTNQLQLFTWLGKHYFCPLHKILKLFIPKRILAGKSQTKNHTTDNQITKIPAKNLTTAQKQAINEITTQKTNKFLIRGITGSGKTEIYTQLAQNYLNQGKQILILVPEISLTPQMIDYFEKAIGVKSAVIHSKLSEGEKQAAWMSIWENKNKLIIGSRSAIFAPFQNLGMIVVDEEHELSYKQDQSPRYTIHQIIDKMLELNPSLKVIFGSATPSIETAEKLKDSTLLLSERIGNSTLPQIEIIDLREEFKKQNYSIFSDRLREELEKIIAKKEQAILFLNRRGSASSIVCRDCGYTEKCTKCEITLTYHAKTLEKPKLICHHCGIVSNPPTICQNCKGLNIRFLGIGTQKIETELLKTFPQIRALRADKDTTALKHGFEEIYKKFLHHEADVLIGTQMIAKGLHLPKVNLVGVILADIGLNIPDFRTTERNFQLMTQVSGRAGRMGNDGKVIIQTYNPDHFALLCTQENNYEKFFKYERTQRKLMSNPPFSKIAKIIIENASLKQCQENTKKLENLLLAEREALKKIETTNIIEITSYPAYLTRLRGKYRYIILIKSIQNQDLIHNLLEKLPKEYIMDTSVKIDIDPISTT